MKAHSQNSAWKAIFVHAVDEAEAVQTADKLRAEGFFIPAIRYPTVARGSARLRITLTAAHTETDISALTDAIRMTHHAFRTS